MLSNNRILVVDDHEENLEVLSELLDSDYMLRCVCCGEQALVEAPTFQPSLVLLDVMMPGIGGIETCRQLRREPSLQETKIVMLSAKCDVDTRLAAYDVGAVDYIMKPFNHDEILAKVRTWMQMVHHDQLDAIWRDAEMARDAVGSAMISLSAFRDTETGEHLFRMRWYTLLLAEQLAFSDSGDLAVDETFLRDIYRAAPLHDIGKVAIADAILCKPGPLTHDEFDAMKRHSELGGDMLARAAEQFPNISYLPMAADIARHHHERYDGTGYPDGLAACCIPLAARIVALADSFDAMTSPRVYKAEIPFDEAAARIVAASGSHFDPLVVTAFQERLDDFRQSQPRMADGDRPLSRETVLLGS